MKPIEKTFKEQPALFRGMPARVLTPEAEKVRRQSRRNQKDRERRAKKAHR